MFPSYGALMSCGYCWLVNYAYFGTMPTELGLVTITPICVLLFVMICAKYTAVDIVTLHATTLFSVLPLALQNAATMTL